MKNVKSGLSLILVGVAINILTLVVTITLPFIQSVYDDSYIYGIATTIVFLVTVVGFIFDLIGLVLAGKGNASFHLASLMKIISIIFALVSLIINYVGSRQNIPALVTTSSWINFSLSIWELLILYNVLKGCKSIAKVYNLASTIFAMEFLSVAWYVFTAIVTSIPFFPGKSSDILGFVFAIVTLILGLLAILGNIFYFVLLIKTRAQIEVKKTNH